MSVRDPQTGKFVSPEDAGYDDWEFATNYLSHNVPASQLGGATDGTIGEAYNFEGLPLYEMDELLDRDEAADLVRAIHVLEAGITSTETADGTLRATMEISTSPDRKVANEVAGQGTGISGEFNGGGSITDASALGERLVFEDSRDLLGRPLTALAYGPITDGTNGVGGAGTAGTDRVDIEDPIGFDLHPRDEMFVNGAVEVANVDDTSVVFSLYTQHVYGVHR